MFSKEGLRGFLGSTSGWIGRRWTGLTDPSSHKHESVADLYDNPDKNDVSSDALCVIKEMSQSMPALQDEINVSEIENKLKMLQNTQGCRDTGDTMKNKNNHKTKIPILKQRSESKTSLKSTGPSDSKHITMPLTDPYQKSGKRKEHHAETYQSNIPRKIPDQNGNGNVTETKSACKPSATLRKREDGVVMKRSTSVRFSNHEEDSHNEVFICQSQSMKELNCCQLRSPQKRFCQSVNCESLRWSSTQCLMEDVIEQVQQNGSKLDLLKDELDKSFEFMYEGINNTPPNRDRGGEGLLLFNELFCYISERISVWRELLQHLLLKEKYRRWLIKNIQDKIELGGTTEFQRTLASLVWWRTYSYLSDVEIIETLMDSLDKIGHSHVPKGMQHILQRHRANKNNYLRVLNEELLLNIAEKLGKEWEQLAFLLGFKTRDLYQLEYKSQNAVQNINKMLLTWFYSGNSDSAILANALIKVERSDLVDLLKPRTKKWYKKGKR